MAFVNRWRIDGWLETKAPLHIGDGGETERIELNNRTKGKPVQIASIAIDAHGKPFLPGRSLKGVLRAWAEQRRIPKKQLEAVFGHRDLKQSESVGSRLAVFDARFDAAYRKGETSLIPYFDEKRQTGVVARVAIDRGRRMALPEKLFYTEFVPEGVRFRVEIGGQDLDDSEIGLLLGLLDGFNDPSDPVRIGAEASSGWGVCAWQCLQVARIDAPQLALAFTDGSALPIGFGACTVMHKPPAPRPMPPVSRWLRLDISLRITGPFLVNEPAKSKDSTGRDEDPNHVPRFTPNGKALLPGESIRGAFRSRAEKIVRTFKPEFAPQPDFDSKHEPTRLDELFGHTGQASRVRFTDFVASREFPITRQEFVAIDRFTGGSADKLKFNAEVIEAPELQGAMLVDLLHVQTWDLGLLAFAVRDLLEGDITLGFGASKGFGMCRGEITKVVIPSLASSSPLAELVGVCGLLSGVFDNPSELFKSEGAQLILPELLKDFESEVSNHAH